nr:hypothetical protein [Streptomyces sp. SID4917]
MTRPTQRPVVRNGAACLLAALVLLGVSGCTGSDGSGKASPPATKPTPLPPSSTPESNRAEHVEGETVTEAPKPVNGGKVLLSTESRRGNAILPLKGEIGAGLLAIQVNCHGKGTLTVSLEPVGLSFPLECVNQEVSSTYNEMHLKRARSEGTVQITAPSTVQWSLMVEH